MPQKKGSVSLRYTPFYAAQTNPILKPLVQTAEKACGFSLAVYDSIKLSSLLYVIGKKRAVNLVQHMFLVGTPKGSQ